MAIIIKKITKKTWFSALSFLGIVVALAYRLFFGGADLNLGKMGASAKNTLKDGDLTTISTVYADSADCSGCTGGDNGPGGSGGSGDDDGGGGGCE